MHNGVYCFRDHRKGLGLGGFGDFFLFQKWLGLVLVTVSSFLVVNV